jgi:hypothetical protein
MGGGGSFYDRDVTNQSFRGSSGATSVAEKAMQQPGMDPSLLPKNRKLVCPSKSPLVYDVDVTGSLGTLPKIIYDKWPGIVGQIRARKYLADPQMSIAATGDIRSDRSPLQMADFCALRNLDKWLTRLHLEGRGGGQGSESYSMTAYYYAYLCDMPNAELPIYLITADEAFVEKIREDDLVDHFGGKHKDTTATKVFADLLKKFKGNVFLIHRKYEGFNSEDWTDTSIIRQWEGVLGKQRIIHLPSDLAIGDVTLGVYAVVSGSRTVEQYLEDMRTRPLDLGEGVEYKPQSAERIREVAKALEPLKDFKPIKVSRSKASEKNAEEKASAKPGVKAKKSGATWKA